MWAIALVPWCRVSNRHSRCLALRRSGIFVNSPRLSELIHTSPAVYKTVNKELRSTVQPRTTLVRNALIATTFRGRSRQAGAFMTDDAATVRLRVDLARQILAWMNDAFAKVDFDAPPDRVVERLTLSWSEVLHRIETLDQTAVVASSSPQSVHKGTLLTGITTITNVTSFDPVD